MKTTLLCTLVALLQVESLVAAADSSCPVFPGFPGRDGMPGPQGPPGTCACSELSTIAASNTDLRNILKESLQNLTDGIIEALREIKQEIAQQNTEEYNHAHALPGVILIANQPHSCKEIFQCNPSAQSGYYWLKSTTTETQGGLLCLWTPRYCNIRGGWMRLVYLNMSEPGASCPTLSPTDQHTCQAVWTTYSSRMFRGHLFHWWHPLQQGLWTGKGLPVLFTWCFWWEY